MQGKWFSLFAVPAALATGALLSGGLAAPRLVDLPDKAAKTSVDVELVLAVDVSYSMDLEELALQRDGYVQALTSPDFLNAVKQGMHGKVAVSYFEWAGMSDQRVVADWHVIDSEASARVIANVIANAPIRRSYRTSISGALSFAAPMFDTSGHRGIRRVIDVSGDGANNQGPPVTMARDQVLEKGISINGLPIMLKRPSAANMDLEELDIYYEDCVIGGPGSFVIPIKDREKFKEAIRTKLVLEIAGREPQARVVPASAAAPRISCLIGERMWQYRWGGRDGN
jgi:uncharacterized protein DUF1194